MRPRNGWTALAALVLTLAAGLAHAGDVVLRLHHMLPGNAIIVRQAMVPWARQVEAQSGGRIRIEFHHAMQLGGQPMGLVDQVQRGDVELAWTVLGYTPGRFPKSEAFELPFMMSSAETGSMAFQDYYEKNLTDEMADVHVIAVHVHGPGVLHMRKDIAIRKIEDLAGLKIRGASRMVNAMLEAEGALPVITAVTSVPGALKSGFIDGAVAPWEVTPAIDLANLAPNHTELASSRGFYSATFMLAMNKKTYEALPDDLKKVIDANSGLPVAQSFGRAMDEGDRLGRDMAAKAGNKTTTLDAAETARWEALGQKVKVKWISEMKARGIDGDALVRDAVSLIDARGKPGKS